MQLTSFMRGRDRQCPATLALVDEATLRSTDYRAPARRFAETTAIRARLPVVIPGLPGDLARETPCMEGSAARGKSAAGCLLAARGRGVEGILVRRHAPLGVLDPSRSADPAPSEAP